MLTQRVSKKPIPEFVEKVKAAVKGANAGQEIKDAVSELLKSYGVEAPEKK